MAAACAVGGGSATRHEGEWCSASSHKGAFGEIYGHIWRRPAKGVLEMNSTWRMTRGIGVCIGQAGAHRRQCLLLEAFFCASRPLGCLLPPKGLPMAKSCPSHGELVPWNLHLKLKTKNCKTRRLSSSWWLDPWEPKQVFCQADRNEGSRGPGTDDGDDNGQPGDDNKLDWDSAWSRFRKSDSDWEATVSSDEQGSLGSPESPAPAERSTESLASVESSAESARNELATTTPKWESEVKEPRLVRSFGGQVRGGKFQMGEGTDRILTIWGNGEAMLVAAGAVMLLFAYLLYEMPEAPWRQ